MVASWAIDNVGAVGKAKLGASLKNPFINTVVYIWWVSPPDPVWAP